MSKTYFKGIFNIRVSQTSTGTDKYAVNEIINAILNGTAIIRNRFILDTTKDNKIMGYIEDIDV